MPGPSLPRRRELGSGAALVLVGGTLGTLLRYGLSVLLPPQDGWPWGTLVANLSGALALGLLLEALAGRGGETARGTRLRLLVGTGALGGYTTYSSYAVETDRLLATGRPGAALAYVAVTLAGGLVAAAVGVRLGSRWAR